MLFVDLSALTALLIIMALTSALRRSWESIPESTCLPDHVSDQTTGIDSSQNSVDLSSLGSLRFKGNGVAVSALSQHCRPDSLQRLLRYPVIARVKICPAALVFAAVALLEITSPSLLLADAVPDKRPVTYGSSVVLVHAATGYKLFSGKISWGSGSGQQAVTAMPPDERVSAGSVMWNVEPSSNSNTKRSLLSPVLATAFHQQQQQPVAALPTEGAAGHPVLCGATIVFEHSLSNATLQAMGASSPISNNREVSAGSGTDNSVAGFKVICSDASAKQWIIGEAVTFEHRALGTNLQAGKEHKFTSYNCGRGCPIEGHIEVSLSNKPTNRSSWSWAIPGDQWKAEPGVLILQDSNSSAEDENDEHDEL